MTRDEFITTLFVQALTLHLVHDDTPSANETLMQALMLLYTGHPFPTEISYA